MNQHVVIFTCMHASWCSVDRFRGEIGPATFDKGTYLCFSLVLSLSLPLDFHISAFPDCSTSSSHKVSLCRMFCWLFFECPISTQMSASACCHGACLHFLTLFLQPHIACNLSLGLSYLCLYLSQSCGYMQLIGQWIFLEVIFSPK